MEIKNKNKLTLFEKVAGAGSIIGLAVGTLIPVATAVLIKYGALSIAEDYFTGHEVKVISSPPQVKPCVYDITLENSNLAGGDDVVFRPVFDYQGQEFVGEGSLPETSQHGLPGLISGYELKIGKLPLEYDCRRCIIAKTDEWGNPDETYIRGSLLSENPIWQKLVDFPNSRNHLTGLAKHLLDECENK